MNLELERDDRRELVGIVSKGDETVDEAVIRSLWDMPKDRRAHIYRCRLYNREYAFLTEKDGWERLGE